jgi:PIN domain nuclease of toxin-antitoxin system
MILLDTHVAVWMLVEDGNLSKKVRVAIREERAQQRKIGCSLVSLYEIANAVRRKRITLSVPVGQFLGEVQKRLTDRHFRSSISSSDARRSYGPDHRRDCNDRELHVDNG